MSMMQQKPTSTNKRSARQNTILQAEINKLKVMIKS